MEFCDYQNLIFVLAVIAGIAVYDISVYLKHGYDGMITATTRKLNDKWPMLGLIVAFVFGLVIGHLFW